MFANIIGQDVSPVDEQFPPTLVPLTFESYGQQLVGRIYVAQGAGPHPTILLLHGFPGTEQSGDLAHIFRRAGWNVLMFHYRGAWGSQGDFSFSHTFEDVHVALAMLRTPEMLEQCRGDTRRIVLIGHSMGGFAALFTAANDPSIHAVASLAGFHFGWFAGEFRRDPSMVSQVASDWKARLPALRGLSSEQLVQEILDHSEEWTLDNYLGQLSQISLLFIGASRDTVAPPHLNHAPLVTALEQHGASHVRSIVLPGDHMFSESRVALARHLLAWLEEVRQETSAPASK